MLPTTLLQASDWTTNTTLLAWLAVISVILGVLSIIIGFWLYRRSKRQKQLGYRSLSDTPIVNVGKQYRNGRIKISYEDTYGNVTPVEDARLLTLKIQNIGKGDIEIPAWQDKNEEKNVEIPIEFEFGGRTVISLTEVKTNPSPDIILPKNLAAYLAASSSTPYHLGLPRCLLQQGQSIELGILLSGKGTGVTWKGALADVEIVDFDSISNKRQKLFIYFLVFMIITMMVLAIFGLWLKITIFILLFTLGIVLVPLLVVGVGVFLSREEPFRM